MKTYPSTQECIDKAGGVNALAQLLGVTRQAVQQFRVKGLPPRRLLQLMELRPEWFRGRKP